MRLGVATLLVTLLFSPFARALGPGDTTERYETGTLTLGGELSPFGGAVGILGGVAELALIPELAVMAGAGAGWASSQFAAGVRPRLPISTMAAASVTVSYSHGDCVELLGKEYPPWSWRDGSYINVDLGVDLRFAKHAYLRPYFGGGKLVHSSAPTRTNGTVDGPPPHQWSPGFVYTGVAVGFWLGL